VVAGAGAGCELRGDGRKWITVGEKGVPLMTEEEEVAA